MPSSLNALHEYVAVACERRLILAADNIDISQLDHPCTEVRNRLALISLAHFSSHQALELLELLLRQQLALLLCDNLDHPSRIVSPLFHSLASLSHHIASARTHFSPSQTITMADPETEIVIEDETNVDEEMAEDNVDEGADETAPGGLEDIEPTIPTRTTFLEYVFSQSFRLTSLN